MIGPSYRWDGIVSLVVDELLLHSIARTLA